MFGYHIEDDNGIAVLNAPCAPPGDDDGIPASLLEAEAEHWIARIQTRNGWRWAILASNLPRTHVDGVGTTIQIARELLSANPALFRLAKHPDDMRDRYLRHVLACRGRLVTAALTPTIADDVAGELRDAIAQVTERFEALHQGRAEVRPVRPLRITVRMQAGDLLEAHRQGFVLLVSLAFSPVWEAIPVEPGSGKFIAATPEMVLRRAGYSSFDELRDRDVVVVTLRSP